MLSRLCLGPLPAIGRRLRRISPRTILLIGLGIFLVYAWPGFVGWDTREHFLQARSGNYADGHPPAVARLVRLCELFVAGPPLLLLIQAVTLLLGLYLIFRTRMSDRAAAVITSLIFLMPPVSGVTGLINKDSLMEGQIVLAIAFLLRDDRRRHHLALLFLLGASLMRWNALAATFAPMLLLYRWRPGIAGVRRYACALAVWFGVTAVSFEVNERLTTQPEYLWYESYAYEDIAGTMEHMPPLDDATLDKMLEGVPLLYHDHIWQRFHEHYSPASHYHLVRDEGHLFDRAHTDEERDAILAAWKRFVLGHPTAYLEYRLENFQYLTRWIRPKTFSNVYVWFAVIAAPQTIEELQHDAAPSKIQGWLIDKAVWFSLGPLYLTFVYFGVCFVLLPLARDRLELSFLLSAIGYELQWLFLAATADFRYSQWMIICSLTAFALVAGRIIARRRRASPPP